MEYENCCRTCLCVVKNIPVKLTDEIYEFLAKDLGIRSVPKEHPELQLPQIVCSNCNSQIMEFQQFLTKCREVEKYFKSKLEMLILTDKDMECNDYKEFIRIDPREDVTNTLDSDNNFVKNFNRDDSFFDPSIVIKEEPQLQEIPMPNPIADDTNTFDSDEDLLENVNDNGSIDKSSSVQYGSLKEATKVDGKPKKNPKHKKKRVLWTVGCSVCGKHLQSFSQLRDHENMHKGIKPYGCDICGQSFTRKGTLVTHQKLHTGEKIECKECGKKFVRSSGLKLHERVHRDEKPFVCDVKDCRAAFRFRPRLVEHQAKHKGERKFRCNICDHAYFSNSSLWGHKKRVHATFIYQCDLCSSSFSNPIAIRKHINSKHKIELENIEHLKKVKDIEQLQNSPAVKDNADPQ